MIKRAAFVLTCCAIISTIQQDTHEVITERLVIVDDEGRPRIVADSRPAPSLYFKSKGGENQIRIAIGGDEDHFPLDQKNVPHISLQAGDSAQLVLSVHAPPEEGSIDEDHRTALASILMNSSRSLEGGAVEGKTLQSMIHPTRAHLIITTYDSEDPTRVLNSDAELYVGPSGEVSTRMREKGD